MQCACVLTLKTHAVVCSCRVQQHMQQLLGPDGMLALPTAPGPAIACDATQQQQNEFRKGLLSLTCIAGLSGLPQVQCISHICC
jgi:amidase